jgi:uncharacterized protein
MSSDELADTPPTTFLLPVTGRERILSIDILRGFALLGILISNIDIFSGPETFYEIPQGLPDTSFINSHLHLNLLILFSKWIFTEGKMRALFSMLFGVGLLLMTEHSTRSGRAAQLPDIYFRRNLWLCAFGFLDGALIWLGDILLGYGLSGLLVLYPCRRLKASTLLIIGTLVTLASSTLLPTFLGTAGDIDLSRRAKSIEAVQQAGTKLTAEQQAVVQQWQRLRAAHATILLPRDGGPVAPPAMYLATVEVQLHTYATEPLGSETFIVIEAVGTMLFGMGLYKSGFLTAERSWATYIKCAAFGFLLTAPFYVFGMWKVYQSGFSFLAAEQWLYRPYELLKLPATVGVISILMLFIKSELFSPVQNALAAVGRTALSNYILTSLLCQYIFMWSHWHYYGKLTYGEHHLVLLLVWVVNIAASLLWLCFFQFGPLEWLWRSLSYWQLQPLRINRPPVPQPEEALN